MTRASCKELIHDQYQEAASKQERRSSGPIRRHHDRPIHGCIRQTPHPDMSQVGSCYNPPSLCPSGVGETGTGAQY
jgi:hypothetical protein